MVGVIIEGVGAVKVLAADIGLGTWRCSGYSRGAIDYHSVMMKVVIFGNVASCESLTRLTNDIDPVSPLGRDFHRVAVGLIILRSRAQQIGCVQPMAPSRKNIAVSQKVVVAKRAVITDFVFNALIGVVFACVIVV